MHSENEMSPHKLNCVQSFPRNKMDKKEWLVIAGPYSNASDDTFLMATYRKNAIYYCPKAVGDLIPTDAVCILPGVDIDAILDNANGTVTIALVDGTTTILERTLSPPTRVLTAMMQGISASETAYKVKIGARIEFERERTLELAAARRELQSEKDAFKREMKAKREALEHEVEIAHEKLRCEMDAEHEKFEKEKCLMNVEHLEQSKKEAELRNAFEKEKARFYARSGLNATGTFDYQIVRAGKEITGDGKSVDVEKVVSCRALIICSDVYPADSAHSSGIEGANISKRAIYLRDMVRAQVMIANYQYLWREAYEQLRDNWGHHAWHEGSVVNGSRYVIIVVDGPLKPAPLLDYANTAPNNSHYLSYGLPYRSLRGDMWKGTWVAMRDFTMHFATRGCAFVVGASEIELKTTVADGTYYGKRWNYLTEPWSFAIPDSFYPSTAVEDGYLISKCVKPADVEKDPIGAFEHLLAEFHFSQ